MSRRPSRSGPSCTQEAAAAAHMLLAGSPSAQPAMSRRPSRSGPSCTQEAAAAAHMLHPGSPSAQPAMSRRPSRSGPSCTQEETVVTKLQAAFRGHSVRSKARFTTKEKTLRGWEARAKAWGHDPKARKAEEQQVAAASWIQARIRGLRARRAVAQKKVTWKRASVKIQKAYRNSAMYKRHVALRKKRKASAVMIQRLYRKRLVEKKEKASQNGALVCPGLMGNSLLMKKFEPLGNKKVPTKTLDLQFCFLGEPGAALLATYLVNCKSLRVLIMKGNYVGTAGLGRLCEAFEKSPSLKLLNLAWNSVGDDGVTRLATSLPKMLKLTELDLSYNHVGNRGATRLMNVLEKGSPIKVVDLEGNSISARVSARLLVSSRCKAHVLIPCALPDVPTKPSSSGKDENKLSMLKKRIVSGQRTSLPEIKPQNSLGISNSDPVLLQTGDCLSPSRGARNASGAIACAETGSGHNYGRRRGRQRFVDQ
eukprot:TRINITY_DN10845_c0_g1_i1.p1 TRINITY_DN10845_c0_g1~~TRINITY_DN10845_c0_g1_i1.p1  ORF type:complete len:480 (+),score=82.40 TRINITY_DN10845_c0_g1_i1:941-2380(+)